MDTGHEGTYSTTGMVVTAGIVQRSDVKNVDWNIFSYAAILLKAVVDDELTIFGHENTIKF